MRDLEGQVAIVTGGGTGIGRAAARELAAAGARVLVAGRRPGPLADTVADIERSGGSALTRPADLADPRQAAELARFALERLGRVDLVVHNAGVSSRVRNIRWVEIG